MQPTASTSKATGGREASASSSILSQPTKGARDDSHLAKRPKLLFMGPRSGGKSSIRKVVFERMAPSDTLFIEKTSKNAFDDINSFISIEIWDLPGGQLDPEQWSLNFAELGAVIFVLDAQSTFHDMIRKLVVTMHKAFMANPGIQFEIFLHKIDGMSEDYRLDTLQNLRDRITEDLFDISPEAEASMNVFYHLTSVFDTSIYEALSKVIQKLIPEQAMLERLLDLLCQQCSMDKAFLFDTSSKIYIATDSAPLDNQTYVICSDYIDLIGDFTLLYESTSSSTSPTPNSPSSHSRSSSIAPRNNTLSPLSRVSSPPNSPKASRDQPQNGNHGSPTNGSSASSNKHLPLLSSSTSSLRKVGPPRLPSSKVKLGTNGTIAQWGINSNLSLVALIRPNMMDQHAALIDYNVSTFRDAVLAIFSLELEHHPGL